MKTTTQPESLHHHSLRVWHFALDLARTVHRDRIANAELRDQAERATTSIGLNIAEAAGREGRAQANHFRIARGSTIEVVSAYELAEAFGEKHDLKAIRELGSTVSAMLFSLARCR